MNNDELEKVAGNGLISRRHLLGMGLGGMSLAATGSVLGADAGLQIPNWSKAPGPGPSAYGAPSTHTQLQRVAGAPNPLYFLGTLTI